MKRNFIGCVFVIAVAFAFFNYFKIERKDAVQNQYEKYRFETIHDQGGFAFIRQDSITGEIDVVIQSGDKGTHWLRVMPAQSITKKWNGNTSVDLNTIPVDAYLP